MWQNDWLAGFGDTRDYRVDPLDHFRIVSFNNKRFRPREPHSFAVKRDRGVGLRSAANDSHCLLTEMILEEESRYINVCSSEELLFAGDFGV